MKKFKGIESYELVSLEHLGGAYTDDENFIDLDITFRITRERGNLVPLFFDNDFEQFMDTTTQCLFDELLQPYMDENGVDVYIMLTDLSALHTIFDNEKNEYIVHVKGMFEFNFKDKRALHLYKLKNGGPT